MSRPLPEDRMRFPTAAPTLRAATLGALVLLCLGATTADARPYRRHNPPGPRGGPGTNWVNPPGPRGGAGASRLARGWRSNPPGPRGGPGTNWANPPGPAGGPGTSPFRVRPYRDRDGNPPGPAGGPGTNWENPPGPRGGPGTSPDRRRGRRW